MVIGEMGTVRGSNGDYSEHKCSRVLRGGYKAAVLNAQYLRIRPHIPEGWCLDVGPSHEHLGWFGKCVPIRALIDFCPFCGINLHDDAERKDAIVYSSPCRSCGGGYSQHYLSNRAPGICDRYEPTVNREDL